MRLKNTLEYLGLWEQLNNPKFKGVEFDPLLNQATRVFVQQIPECQQKTRSRNEINRRKHFVHRRFKRRSVLRTLFKKKNLFE
jgi:hypothetical protein